MGSEARYWATIAESNGGPYNEAAMKLSYRNTGMEKAAEHSGAVLNYDPASVELTYPAGKIRRDFEVIHPIAQADIIVNMGKLKKVITKPEKAVHIIERMYKDIKATNEKTKTSDAKIAALQTDSIKASDDALAYKEALKNKNN